MPDYKVAIANCVIPGEDFTVVGNRKVRNLIHVTFDSFDLEIYQINGFHKSVAHKFKGETRHTTDIIIRSLPRGAVSRAKVVIQDVVELLSFVTFSRICLIQEEYCNVHYHSCHDPIQSSWSILKRFRGKYIKEYLESTQSEYRRLKDTRKFNVVVHYFTSIHADNQPLEIKLVLLFVLFENLKHTYAKQRGYPLIGNRFYSMGTTNANRRSRQPKSFKTLLSEMFNTVRMRPNLDDLIKLRNEIIHSGISSLSVEDRYSTYVSCQKIFREYFLRLLKFKGEYKLCDEEQYRTM